MLKLDNVRMAADHQVHGDDDPAKPHLFYVMPRFPRIARLETGGLSLRFVEYDAIRVAGASQFGGFVAFDTDLTMLPDTEVAIRAALQAEVNAKFPAGSAPTVELQTVPWLKGAVRLVLQQDGKVVEKVSGATAPSLTGNNTACFFLELTVLGTAIFKDTLSHGSSSAIQVIYDLDHYCRLPLAEASGTWHADSFYSFFQDVDTEDNFWSEDSYTEITNTTRYKNEVTETHFKPVADPGLTPEQQAEFDGWVHELITKQLEDGVQRNLLEAVQAVDPDVSGWTEDQDIEDVHREVSNTQISDVHVGWTEEKAIIRQIHPQGSLPTVTSLKGPDGQPLKFEDYYSKISVDEFLRTLQLSIRVDAKFADYGITLVEVKVRYPHGDNAKVVEPTFTATNVGDVQKAEFIVADKIRTFFWSYTVHFEGDSPPWTSEETEDDGTDLNVKLSNLPVLKLDVVNGDINFEQVARARVRVRYDGGVHPVERFFNLDADSDATGQRLLEVIGRPRTGMVTYQTTYTMKGDGREITGPEQTTDADIISIDDPFRALRTVTFQAVGDPLTDFEEITVQATYEEAGNGYLQSFSVTLSADKRFESWTFPTIDETRGTLSYEASVSHQDGTTTEVAEAEAKGSRFKIGRLFTAKLDVTVVPDLLDWTKLKLVNVSLRYVGDGTEAPVTKELLFRPTDTAAAMWSVPLRDATLDLYSVTATYFKIEGDRKVVQSEARGTGSVFLELPA